MNFIDLHCDTLYKSVTENKPLDDRSMEVKKNPPNIDKKLQCYAIWIPDNYSHEKAEKTVFFAHKKLSDECKRLNISLIKENERILDKFKSKLNSAVFTIENSAALNSKLENIGIFAKLGVKIMTLTWNDSNIIGDGAGVINPTGITSFGKEVVYEMEKQGIVVDISHASDELFYDIAEISTRPFIATHSNSRSVTNNKRNLTDEQFELIIKQDGIVGLNFHRNFLSNNPSKADKYDILRHSDKFLSLGGENSICFGTDFDGCDLPQDLSGSENIYEIYEMFLRHNYKESLIRKIFFENALNFFENFDNGRIM